jgi:hypothetical protein
MTRAAGVDYNKVDAGKLLGLGPIIELHPKETKIVPEAFDRSTMNAQLEVERLERVGAVRGIQGLKRGRDIEVTRGSPAGRSAKVGFIQVTEVVAEANSSQGHEMVGAAIAE